MAALAVLSTTVTVPEVGLGWACYHTRSISGALDET